MLEKIGMTHDDLQKSLRPSSEIIERSVALPIMVRTKPAQMDKHANLIYETIIGVL